MNAERAFADQQLRAELARLKKECQQLKDANARKKEQRYDDNELLKQEHKAELAQLKKEQDAALKAAHAMTKELQRKNEKLQEELHQVREKYAVEMQAKNDDIAELKEVMQDMKTIYNAEVEALIGENKQLSRRVPTAGSLAMRESQVFVTWPESQAVRTVHYPDFAVLSSHTVEQLQPFKLGVNRASLLAQFGDVDPFRTGGFQNETEVQMQIDQLSASARVATLKFKWLNFDNGYYDRPHWYFEFVARDGLLVGFANNRPGDDEEQVAQEGYELKQENDEELLELAADEVIVSLKLGLDDYSNIVNVQFVLGRLLSGQ